MNDLFIVCRLEFVIVEAAEEGAALSSISLPNKEKNSDENFTSSSHRLAVVGLQPVHRLCGVIEGRLSHFLSHWPRVGWQNVISQGKITRDTQPWLNLGHREDRQ